MPTSGFRSESASEKGTREEAPAEAPAAALNPTQDSGRAAIAPRQGVPPEVLAENAERVGTEAVAADARDLSVALLEAMHFVQALDTAQSPEAEHECLTEILRQLPARILAEAERGHHEVRVLEERARALEAVHVDSAHELDAQVRRADRLQGVEIFLGERVEETLDESGGR